MKPEDFLAQKRIAVAGASRGTGTDVPANRIYRRLKHTGHDVVAVNPNMSRFDGDRCYASLRSIPDGVDGVVIVTRPETTEQIVRECHDAGIRSVWMHRSLGVDGSSVSPKAVEYCRQHGIDVIPNGCPLMFGPGTDFGHTCMRWILKLKGGVMNVRKLRIATIIILVVDVAYIAWGGMAAATPEGLLGPGGKAILPAAYDGYTGGSWAELLRTSPMTAKYVALMYRMYGIYCALFGVMASAIAATAFRRGARWAWWTLLVGNTVALVSAIRMDWISNAVGPFELTEYLGLVAVWAALAMAHPFLSGDVANPRHTNVPKTA